MDGDNEVLLLNNKNEDEEVSVEEFLLELQNELMSLYLENQELRSLLEAKNRTIKQLEYIILNNTSNNNTNSKDNVENIDILDDELHESVSKYILQNKEKIFNQFKKILTIIQR